jgi:putative transposase
VTICTHQRECLVGSVDHEMMRLTPAGQIAGEVWFALPDRFPNLVLHAFVVMPNHVHDSSPL